MYPPAQNKPNTWVQYLDYQQRPYWYNPSTGQSTYDNPYGSSSYPSPSPSYPQSNQTNQYPSTPPAYTSAPQPTSSPSYPKYNTPTKYVVELEIDFKYIYPVMFQQIQ